MSGFAAFYDASVLYPSELRNLLMHLALTGLFRAKWSALVHEEWIGALLRHRPDLSREKLDRTRMLMDLHAVDALVTGYEDLIEGLSLPDPDDRHVLAAAIRGRAQVNRHCQPARFPGEDPGTIWDRTTARGRVRAALTRSGAWPGTRSAATRIGRRCGAARRRSPPTTW